MKTCKHLLSLLVVALLCAMGVASCQDYDIPAANTSLSYPSGEMALGSGTYTSAQPTLLAGGEPQFAITKVTHNGKNQNKSIAQIDKTTGIITLSPAESVEAVGEYLVSVQLTVGEQTTEYADALKVIVKGIIFEKDHVAATRGVASQYAMKEAYLAQVEGTHYSLVAPENEPNYAAITVDPKTCEVKVSADAEAGVYPIAIQITNSTNPEGVVFENVLTITVESKPYDLVYSPAAVSLIPMEGHLSPRPTVKAASLTEGTAVKYELLDDFNGVFTINAEDGIIALAEDQELVQQVAKTYELQVRVSNEKGGVSFPKAYTITVDPTKKAEPISSVVYNNTFPVELHPSEAWTSERPTVIGSTVGIKWSLVDAPQGVTIDAKTGIITMVEGHSMPLKVEDNKLKVQVMNQGMATPYEVMLGDFKINPFLWQINFGKNSSKNSLTVSGILNMDRHSYSGPIVTNKNITTQAGATSEQVKNAWGKAKGINDGMECIDFCGFALKTALNAKVSNQNNDWLVSGEFTIPAAENISTFILFDYASQFGKDEENCMELYIVEDAQHLYAEGDVYEDTKGMNYQPSNLQWRILGTTNTELTLTPGAELIKANHSLAPSNNLSSFLMEAREFNISDYKGKTVRFALRCWNPQEGTSADMAAGTNGNQRTFRVKNLRVEARLN